MSELEGVESRMEPHDGPNWLNRFRACGREARHPSIATFYLTALEKRQKGASGSEEIRSLPAALMYIGLYIINVCLVLLGREKICLSVFCII